MKLHPKLAEILDVKISGGATRLEAYCPFCKSLMRINIPHLISCSYCKHKVSVYPREVKESEKQAQLTAAVAIAQGKLPSDVIGVPDPGEATHTAFDTLKFRLISYVPGSNPPKEKWMVEIVQNYNLNKSCLTSFKGRPFQMELDSLIPLNYSDIPAMLQKISMLLMFR